MSDQTIERLEAELRESRFMPWDVETFLAKRHQTKIEALTATENKWARHWLVIKEIATFVLAYIGFATISTIAGAWLLLGEFPIHRGQFNKATHQEQTVLPPSQTIPSAGALPPR